MLTASIVRGSAILSFVLLAACSSSEAPAGSADLADASTGDSVTQEAAPCGDGICNAAERANPLLCPTDCPTGDSAPGDSQSKCGDGVCDPLELSHPELCPQDCAVSDSGIESAVFSVLNPTSGVAWWAISLRDPGLASPSPTVVMVPGGSGTGSSLQQSSGVATLVSAGYVVILFDAEGRGNTGGTEDYNGVVDQDGLAAVVQASAQRSEVDPSRMGLFTQSFGITMGSGTLARHPNLPIRFLLDWEGPADRNDTGHCDASNTGHITHDCADEAWWSEREARVFVAQIAQPYLRVQNQTDHAQPDNHHCVAMIHAATKPEFGGAGSSAWTRVNDADMNAANTVFSDQSPPTYFQPSCDRDSKVLEYVHELFTM